MTVGESVRPPARPHLPVHHRDVGALLLLRDALAARPLHDKISAAAGARRRRARARAVEARARNRVRPARRAAAVVADLGLLHRAGLFHADVRRPPRRPRARPAPHRGDRRRADGDRPFHDGGRAAVPVRAAGAHSRQRRASSPISRLRSAGFMRPATGAATAPIRSSMSASMSAHSWRRWSAARSAKKLGWHYGFAAAGVGMCIGLAIYLYALPHLPPTNCTQAARRAQPRHAARPRRAARGHGAARSVRAQHLVLGDLRAEGQYDDLWADANTDRTIDCSAVTAKSRRPGFSPSIRS